MVISFSKKVLEDLNYPANVQFCMDVKNRVFAIRPCNGNEARAAVFSKPKSEQVSMLSITNKNLKDTISLLIPDFDDSLKYTVVGEFDMENRIMYYDMSTAEVSSMRTSRKDVE